MTDVFKVLAQGQLPSSVGAIYSPTTAVIIKGIHLANPTGSTRTARLYVNGSDDAHTIMPPASILAGGFAVSDDTITLASGNTLQGVSDAATSITYTIFGDEVT